jgi:hypothetical protein
VITAHVPSGRQQAPVGGVHAAVLQAVPSPRYTPLWVVQNASVVIKQNPTGKQQAPVGCWLQVTPAHVVPLPPYVPPISAHRACVVTTQVPVGRQQLPVGVETGQLFGLHEVPLPRYSPPAARQSWSV